MADATGDQAQAAHVLKARSSQTTSLHPALPGVDENRFKICFQALDLNDSGAISGAEIRAFLATAGIAGVTQDEIDEMVRMGDEDGSGEVTFEAFREIFCGPRREATLDAEAEGEALDSGVDGASRTTPAMHELIAMQPKRSEEALAMERRRQRMAQDAMKGISDAGKPVAGVDTKRQPIGGAAPGARSAEETSALDTVSGLRPAQIKKLVKRFHDQDKDSNEELDYTEFLNVLKQQDKPLMRRLFEIFDVDKSKKISIKEFLAGISSLSASTQAEKLKFSFMLFDSDGSGFLEKAELVAILQANFLSQNMDYNELARRADKILQAAGPTAVQDGRLSFQEMQDVAKRSPGLMFPAVSLLDRAAANVFQ